MKANETLIKYIRPYPQEILSSYILRTARENLMDNTTWIIEKFNDIYSDYENPIKINTVDWLDDKRIIANIAHFFSLTDEEIYNMTFTSTINKLELDWDNIHKSPWLIYRTVKFCPLCLKSDRFVRKDWCLSQSICCNEHNIYLVDKCSSCKREINSKTVIKGKCSCGQKLNIITSPKVSENRVTDYQSYVNHFLYKQTVPQVEYNCWINDSTKFFKSIELFASWIPLITNSEFIPTVDGFEYNGSSHARTRLKKTKAQSQSIVLYSLANSLLKQWPESYHTLLEYTYSIDAKKLEMFYIRVIMKQLNTPLSSISLEFTSFLQSRFLSLNKDLQLLRMDEAKSLFPRFKETTINRDIISSFQITLNKTKVELFNLKEVTDWSSNLTRCITKEELRKIWKTSAKATLSILANNILDGVYTSKLGSVVAWSINQDSLLCFGKTLGANSGGAIIKEISLNRAFEWVGPTNANLIIKGMLEGSINFSLNPETLGYTTVCKKQCYDYLEDMIIRNSKYSGAISIRNLVFIFGVQTKDILHWIYTGRLELRGADSVTYLSFIKFYTSYLTSYQLSRKQHKSVKQILKLHQLGKIKPIYGPHTGDGKRLLFSKEEYNYN